jgi:acetyltransferase-like isoleucine patch superfamily enzyme
VVTRDVPQYAVVVGVPARVVGSMRDIEECTP